MTIERSYFNDQSGLSAISRLISTASSADRTATISHARLKYYALGAVNAVVEWLAKQGMAWSKGCLAVEWIAVEGTMLIDGETIRDLELLTNVSASQAGWAWCNRLLKAPCAGPRPQIQSVALRSAQPLLHADGYTHGQPAWLYPRSRRLSQGALAAPCSGAGAFDRPRHDRSPPGRCSGPLDERRALRQPASDVEAVRAVTLLSVNDES